MADLSIIRDSSLRYPDEAPFSPGEKFPEYAFEHLSSQPNPVYAAVRACLAGAGLDREHYGTAGWNPFRHHVNAGENVFVLCNFVAHRRQESLLDFQAKCTQAAVLRPLLDYLLLAVGPNGSITFGNAPVQSCQWSAVLEQTGARHMLDFYERLGKPVQARDLRLYVAERTASGAIKEPTLRHEADAVTVDLAADSLLAPISGSGPSRFRVSDYDPRRIQRFHCEGSHKYVLNRHLLEADVVVSLPKLKTHEKVGITCALKGFVGAIGHKDCLAHHRFGAPSDGGDEYPSDATGLKRLMSHGHDLVQRTAADSRRGSRLRVADRILRGAQRRLVPVTSGAWWGNDTCWRMALDIARLVHYVDAAGRLHDQPQRRHLVLVDGVVGGEGSGPLKPTAVHSGLILFAENVVSADYACATLMGFDPEKIALIHQAATLHPYPLASKAPDQARVTCNGEVMSLDQLSTLPHDFYQQPPGWVGHIESTALEASDSAPAAGLRAATLITTPPGAGPA